MRTHLKEISILSITLIVAITCIWYFFRQINLKKTAEQTDIYTYMVPSSNAVITINQPLLFTQLFLSKQSTSNILQKHIPEVYLSIIQSLPAKTPVLFSFHSQGIVMYAKTNKEQIQSIEKNILFPFFHSYTPHHQAKDHIHYTYLADTNNRFFGYYQYKGIWVTSYSKKLLEETAQKQLRGDTSLPANLKISLDQQDPNAPMSITIPSDLLNIHVQLNDSSRWETKNTWLPTDIFINGNTICFHGNYPDFNLPDSLYTAFADSISLRLKQWETTLETSFQIDSEDSLLFFTGCSPLSD